MGLALFALMARRGRVRAGQAASLTVLVVAIALGVWVGVPASSPPGGCWDRFRPPRIDSQDWAISVVPRERPGKRGWVLDYVNLRTNKRASHEFAGEVAPLDFLGEDRVYLAADG